MHSIWIATTSNSASTFSFMCFVLAIILFFCVWFSAFFCFSVADFRLTYFLCFGSSFNTFKSLFVFSFWMWALFYFVSETPTGIFFISFLLQISIVLSPLLYGLKTTDTVSSPLVLWMAARWPRLQQTQISKALLYFYVSMPSSAGGGKVYIFCSGWSIDKV